MAIVKEFLGLKVPEGATSYLGNSEEYHTAFYKELGGSVYYSLVPNGKWEKTAFPIPRDAVELPQEQEYIPKVGDSCEYTAIRDGDGQYSAILAGIWYGCKKVIAFHDGHVWTSDNGIRPLKNTIFRPLKTEREKTVDAAIAVMNNSLDDSQQGWALALYDHGMLKMSGGES